MKRFSTKARIITAVAVCVLALVSAATAIGASGDETFVTLGYLNNTVIPKITEDVKNAVLAVIETAKPAETPETPETPKEPEIPDEASVTPNELDLSSLKFSVVFLKKGEKLFASGENTDCTEIVLRAGKVSCISPFDDQGIADLTASGQLYNGDELTLNNYCIIPRGSDGRGIYAENSDAYILVRGEYEIVQ